MYRVEGGERREKRVKKTEKKKTSETHIAAARTHHTHA